MHRRWLGRRAHASKAVWFLVLVVTVILLAWTAGHEKRQSPSSPAAPGAARTAIGPQSQTHDEAGGATSTSTSLLMRRAPQPEDAAAGAGATATSGPAVNDHGPMETPFVVAPAAPSAPETKDKQDARTMDDDDDDRHELFAEELKAEDDDDAAATTTGTGSMTVAECAASYGGRHFLRENQRTAPPILYSFPGKLKLDSSLASHHHPEEQTHSDVRPLF